MENIISYLEQREIDSDGLKETTEYKQRFKSERYNVFTE